MSLVELRDAVFRYPETTTPALDGVTLSIEDGEVVGLAGPTGAGKTTLCLTLVGLAPHATGGDLQGVVSLGGRDSSASTLGELLAPLDADRALVAVTFQDPESQIVGMTVEEDLAFGPENLGVPREEIGRRIGEALDFVRLGHLRTAFPYALSGGQKQRVAIAAALVMRPRLLILDEPTSELDPQGRAEIFELIGRLAATGDYAVLVVEHALDDLAAAVNRSRAERTHSTRSSRFHHGRVAVGGARLMTNGGTLRAEGIWFRYPGREPALAGVDLEILAGQFVALVGQNGSGKTTLAKHFNGLLRPERGIVRVDGEDIAGRSTADLAAVIGYCYQNPDHQIFATTVADEIEFGPRNLGVPEEEVVRRTGRLLDLVRLRPEADRYPFSLGRGQRQKLAVASVLAMEPRIVIVDEPTTGLDWQGGEAMMAVMRELHQDGRTIMIITHDMNIVAEFADRMVVMADGRIVADGPPADVFTADSALREAYLRPPQAFRIARQRPDLFGSALTVGQAAANLAERIHEPVGGPG